MKIQLLKLLCQKPDALFMDEPTNDLDIDTLMFLEEFIKNCKIPLLFISHDEVLISHTANVIIHIEQLIRKTKSVITISRLPYDDYVEQRNLQFDKQTQVALKERSEYKKKKERLQQLYEKARHNTSWVNPDGIISSDGGAKRSMQAIVSRGKRFEREKENFTDIPNREECIVTRFDSEIYIPPQKRILDFSLPELKVDGKLLAKDINLSVIGNQHICIIGKNGAGKSTLLKEIWNVLKERKDIVASYMPQDYRDIIDYSLTPTEFLQSSYDKEKYTLALTHMGTMKFTRDEMKHTIGELSGGQRAKIIFLNMVLQKANVLILDEPTRNFSPLSAPVIRQALMDFHGTIISISHDRKYLDEVADLVYVLSEDGLKLLQ
ncbi:MAG: ABC-F family ATP-binding cassette domain-containing protein [Anaerotignum sp.]|nr:ABC-F family ATP-binding cassette domain-containing protein [Anaerotignum sp.]